MNSIRKYHKILGIIMLIPLIIWGLSGLFFFVKPGYDKAFEQIKVKTYPIDREIIIPEEIQGEQYKIVKTILGYHLLVTKAGVVENRNALNQRVFNEPSTDSLKLLINDALTFDKERYGEVKLREENKFITTTGIELTFDWNSLSLYQKGADTDFINFIYRLHYLQFTGQKEIDAIIGLLGIAFILLLSVLGGMLLFGKKN